MSESAPLAIIGISCLFPKADDLQAYWSNIKNGVDAITPVPELTHWRADDFFNPDPKAPDQTYGRRGGFIPPVNFNPLEFGIAPKDIEAIDTTQLLGMVAAKQALVDAGYGDKTFNRDRTSVILGVTGALELVIPLGARLGHPIWRRALKEAGVNETVAEDVVQRIADSYVPWQENSFPGLLGNVAAGRIASRLDLGGTNCVVDAACASSLAALHLAWLELATGRSDMVITGGVDTFNNIFMYMCFSKTPALSPTGDAKPFDRDCDGTILGEGLGILVLKRLADAERDGDKIYAVLKGLGSSSDGRGNAIYAPRADGQKEALKRAYGDAQTSPDTIELIEAHGTGTKVGDATEISALTEVFRAARPEGTWTALGSVKSQIGHAKAAAGVAGLIKAALALEHKVLPPTIKVNQPLDEAAPGRSPFYVNTQKRPWLPRPSHPRRAGVSAFGFGGTNFHCVLEEHGGQRKRASWDGDVEIIALSAEQLPDLRAQVAALSADLPWPEVRRLAHRSRAEFKLEASFRLLLPVSKGASLATPRDAALTMIDQHPEKTHWSLPNGAAFGSGTTRGKLGVLFPGQGSQYTGMFRDLACQFPEVLDALAAGDRVFAQERPDLGSQRLSDFIYPHPAFTDDAKRRQEETLKATDVAQPALGAISLGALNLVKYFGITPEAAAGHSYGELPALCGAGRLQPESLHQLSNVRGRLMACRNGHSDRGSMLAVQASEEMVAKLVGESSSQLVIANRNSPSQFVLAGPKLQIHQAAEEAARQSIRARILPVSAAFHSTLVADAKEPFSVALQGISFGEGHIPVYANSTAKAYPAGAIQTRELLANQMVQPVNFIEQIETMFADGVTTFLELGPGHVLSDLTQAILQGKNVEAIALDSSRGTRSGTFDLAVALCRLAALGHTTDLTRWEDAPPAKPAVGTKPALTIPVSGANVRNPRPQRPPVKPASPPAASNGNGTHAIKQTPTLAPTSPSMQTPLVQSAPALPAPSQTQAELPADVSAALQIAQQGMLTLQKLQEQTAQLHRQFLEGQETARRTLEALLSQRRDLLNPGGSGVIRSAPSAVPASVERADSSAPAKSEQPAFGSNGKNSQQPAPARGETPVQAQSSQASVATVAGVSVVEASQTLLNVVSEKTGYPVEMLNLDMGLDTDLGVDSIKRVEIMAAIRTQLPGAPEIKPEHLGTLQTLQQVVDFLTAGAELRKSTPAEVQREMQAMPAVRVASAGVDSAEASQVLLGVVSEKTGYPVEMLNLEMGLDSDLGVDSIKRVEIMAAIHTRLPAAPEIKPEHLGTLQTLQQVVDFLTSGKAQTVSAQTEVRSLKPAGLLKETPSLDAGGHKDASEALDRQIVRPAQLGEGDNQPAIVLPQGSLIWVTDDTTDLSAMVAANLKDLGFNVRHANPTELLKSNCELLPSALVILWPAVHGGDAFLKQAFQLIQTAGASLRSAGRNGAGILTSVSRLDGVFGFGALNGKCDPISGGLAGLVKTARHEWPEVNCKALDVSPELAASPAVAAQIVQEMFRLGPVEVGLSAGSRFGLSIQTVPFVGNGTAPVLNAGDLVVVTGGARGITATTALQLARTYKPHFVMLGRSHLAESEPAWLSGLQSEADIKKALLSRTKGDRSPRRIEARYREIIAQREIREHLRQMRSAGATALYRTVDVRDAAQINAVIKEMRAEFGPVHGLIHGAGVLADKRIEDKTGEQFDLVYSTKVAGLKNLLASVADDDLKLLALFSSYTARFGRTGQADYAAANEVLNKMAQVESRRRPKCRVVSFNWGPWNGGMVSDGLRQIFESEGVGLIEPEAGSRFFVRELATPSTDAVEVVALAASSAARSSVSGRNGNGRHDHSESVPAASPFHPAFDREVSVSALPCLESHVLHGRAVLPAALMIEWLAHGALHGNPGMMFHGFDDFKVLKGIVLDPGSSVQVSVQAASSHAREGGLVVPVRLVSQAGERLLIHARADILLTDTLPDAPAPAFDVHRNGCTSAVYGDGRLFHGPHFQSIELLETCSKTEIAALVKGSPAPKHWFENPLRPGWLADPLALDASFQMLILWSCEQREAPSLPCAIARFRQFTPAFPINGSRVTAQVTSGQSPVAKADLLFFDRQGGLLALAQGYECVVDPGLRDAFRLNCLSLET